MKIYKNALGAAMAVLMGFLVSMPLASCSETDDEDTEYANWQERNDEYWSALYRQAQQNIAAGDSSWRIYPLWSIQDSAATKPTDHIIVHVLEKGSGTVSPVATDTTIIHYSGRLIPSASYPDGYNFDKSWASTEWNAATALPVKFAASAGISGFNTALQLMHKGDHWMVYIPYNAGYGSTGSTKAGIPAYSNLIFDLRLADFYHIGEYYPSIK